MTDIPGLSHINLAQTLVKTSESHAKLHDIIAGHAEKAAQARAEAHDKLAAENVMKGV